MLAYDVVDVFADRPFTGNRLAVVHGAEELSIGQCLAITQEFGCCESGPAVGAGGHAACGAGDIGVRFLADGRWS